MGGGVVIKKRYTGVCKTIKENENLSSFDPGVFLLQRIPYRQQGKKLFVTINKKKLP